MKKILGGRQKFLIPLTPHLAWKISLVAPGRYLRCFNKTIAINKPIISGKRRIFSKSWIRPWVLQPLKPRCATSWGETRGCPPSLIKGAPPIKRLVPLVGWGGGGKKSTQFCNLTIYEFLGKGVYQVFLDIFTISSATYYDIALILQYN